MKLTGLNRLSLRWRLMLIGTTGLSVGLAIGGLLLLSALSLGSIRNIDASATRTAADVADLVNAGSPPPQPVPVAGIQLVQVVQVVQGTKTAVLAASIGVDRMKPLLTSAELSRALSGERFDIDGGRAGLNQPLRVLAVAAGPTSSHESVIVAAPLGDDRGNLRALRMALLALFLPLVLGLAAIAWWVIGRTLRPVEVLRAGAEEITGSPGSDARLPVPASADEIQRLALTLNGMLDRLEAARRSQRQFVADAAHELRNPLAGMRTHLEVAQRHPARVDWQELTDDLLTDTSRLSELADGLLLLAGADETGASPRRTTTEIPVVETLTKVAARYREARVNVAVRDVDGLETLLLRANSDDLHRILTNLVDNAVRYASTNVWLSAAPDPTGPTVCLTVIDDGPGIPEADREFVVQRFTRLDDARATDQGGAGLGLAIVTELIRRNNGTLTLDDAAAGLLVKVSFPQAARLSL